MSRGVAVILGNGGAALGAATALGELGFQKVHVSARSHVGPRETWRRADSFQHLDVSLLEWGTEAWRGFEDDVSLVLQATSAGMLGGAPGESVSDAVPWERLPANAVAYDVVYNPTETQFLRDARERGLDARGGLGMLVGQAAAALELWLDLDAPRAAMFAAARAALGQRDG